MKRTSIVWTVAMLVFAARPAYAWDDFGHRLVARIAWTWEPVFPLSSM